MTKREQLQKLIEQRQSKDPLTKLVVKTFEENNSKIDLALEEIEQLKSIEPEPGYTPEKGIDYFTQEEVDSFVSYIQSQVENGKDSTIPGPKGDKGDKGDRGTDGTTPEIDYDKIIKDILKKIPKPKDGVSPKIEDLIKVVKKSIPDVNYKEEIGKILATPGFRMLLHGGGLSSVAHGTSLTGNGTLSSPLEAVGYTGGTAGSVLFVDPADTIAQDNSNLFYDNTNNFLGVGGQGVAPAGTLDVTQKEYRAVVGSELITATADRDFSSDTGNWTGTGWTIGGGVATHTAGANNFTLATSAIGTTVAVDKIYRVTYTIVTTTAGTLNANVGNGGSSNNAGLAVGTVSMTQVFYATQSSGLVFTPDANWAGTLDNISLVEITTTTPVINIKAPDSVTPATAWEIRVPKAGLGNNNMGIGKYSAGAIGGGGGSSGRDNYGWGQNSIRSVTSGSNNMGMGRNALSSMTTGSTNTAIGSDCLGRLNPGNFNSGLGNSAFNTLYTGSNNVGLGFGVYSGLTAGSNNVGMGYNAGINLTGGDKNITIGTNINVVSATGSNQLNIGNIIFGTGVTGTGSTIAGAIGIGMNAPTAILHLKAGTTTANTAPLKFTSGTLLSTAEAGAVEFLTDKFYGTITTGAARKELTLNDAALTSGRIPFVTTNGRITDDADFTFTASNSNFLVNSATGTDGLVLQLSDTLDPIDGFPGVGFRNAGSTSHAMFYDDDNTSGYSFKVVAQAYDASTESSLLMSASGFEMNSSSGFTMTGSPISLVATQTDISGKLIMGGVVRLKGYTVATLPAGTLGDTAMVSDALAPAFGVAVVGGGAVNMKVFYDGTNWKVG